METMNLDAGETAFLERELEHRKAQTYDIVHAPLNAFRLIPTDSTAGPGAETIVYEQWDATGIAKIIANYADDLPRANVRGKEFVARVRSVGNSYGYTVQDVRAAARANKPLNQRQSNAAAEAQRKLWNQIAFYGDEEFGMQGLLTNPNIPTSSAPNGAGGSSEFTEKTPDEVITNVNSILNGVRTLTNDAEVANTVVMPVEQHAYISTKRIGDGTDTTILAFLRAAHPGVSFESANELSAAQLAANGITAFTGDIMIAYRRDPDVLTLEMPQWFEQFQAQLRGLEYVVPCHSRIAGVLVYRPLAMAIMDSI